MSSHVIADSDEIGRMVRRLGLEIGERNRGLERVGIVGIQTRGVPLAKRIRGSLGREVPFGTLDITFYRDDFAQAGFDPQVRETDLAFDVSGMRLVLVDDVLHTGRTIRAAMDVLMDYGRPASIQLAVLVDRGGRELPIAPTFVGMTVAPRNDEAVRVYLSEVDAAGDAIRLVQRKETAR